MKKINLKVNSQKRLSSQKWREWCGRKIKMNPIGKKQWNALRWFLHLPKGRHLNNLD
jgi:hypothetical protein